MAAFVAFELWIPLLAIMLRAVAGPTIPTALQAVVPLFGLAVPVIVGLGLSDYLADRQGLVRPYQPKPRPADQELNEEPGDGDPGDGDPGDGGSGDGGSGDGGSGDLDPGDLDPEEPSVTG